MKTKVFCFVLIFFWTKLTWIFYHRSKMMSLTRNMHHTHTHTHKACILYKLMCNINTSYEKLSANNFLPWNSFALLTLQNIFRFYWFLFNFPVSSILHCRSSCSTCSLHHLFYLLCLTIPHLFLVSDSHSFNPKDPEALQL